MRTRAHASLLSRTAWQALLLLLVAAMALAGWLAWFAARPVEVPAESRALTVPPGRTLKGVAQDLVARGVLIEPWSFTLLAQLYGRGATIKAGRYALPEHITPYRLVEMLVRGEVAQASITFIEGWTFRQARDALAGHPDVRHESDRLSDIEVLDRVGAPHRKPEGLFFPDTYLFNAGTSDLAILVRAYNAMQTRLAALWAERAPGLPYASPYEALIMASIVEKETGAPSERPMIAAVFVNRLKRGMLLQTDPSVIYGIGAAFDGNLRKRDLEADTPYNTYTRAGLPPTPIALPGEASLQAALRPADSAALYFVARGDGSSAFSATLEEHNQAVQRYQLKQ
jgi:UPF0755 protein